MCFVDLYETFRVFGHSMNSHCRLYPVDKKRTNEFGQSFDNAKKEQ
jgi:hypothetical protein